MKKLVDTILAPNTNTNTQMNTHIISNYLLRAAPVFSFTIKPAYPRQRHLFSVLCMIRISALTHFLITNIHESNYIRDTLPLIFLSLSLALSLSCSLARPLFLLDQCLSTIRLLYCGIFIYVFSFFLCFDLFLYKRASDF